MRRKLTLLCGCLLGLSVANAAFANPVAPVTPSAQPVRFATSTVRPWGMNIGGKEQGLLVNVFNALHRHTGIAASNQLQPYPRVIYSVYSGVVDLAVLFDSPSARENAIRVGHLVDTRVLIVARSGTKPIDSLEQLEGQLVGYIRGSKYGPSFDNATHFTRLAVNTMEQGLAMLIRNRLDAMAGTDQSFYWAMKQMRLGTPQLSKLLVVGGATGSLYMSKNSPRQDLIPVYQDALEALHKDGTLSEIFSESHEWGVPENWPDGPR